MKTQNLLLICSSLFLVLLIGCEPVPQSPEDYADNDNFTVKLSADRSAGDGQYFKKVESGNEVAITVNVRSSSSVKEFSITKTANVKVDSSFGSNGTMTVDASGSNFEYQFNYIPKISDINKLIGFNFKAVNGNGESEESDLTLNVTLSPEDNMTMVKWNLTSIKHVNQDNEETIADCNEGYSLLLNADSTMTKNYGETACGLDGLNVYNKWYFSENEEQIMMESYNVFDPSATKTDTFTVKTLTTEEMGLEQTVDLTELGEGIETFLYTYEAAPR